LGISLLREKDKFRHKKNSLGLKKKISLLPENNKNAPGKKTKPLYKKNIFQRSLQKYEQFAFLAHHL